MRISFRTTLTQTSSLLGAGGICGKKERKKNRMNETERKTDGKYRQKSPDRQAGAGEKEGREVVSNSVEEDGSESRRPNGRADRKGSK